MKLTAVLTQLQTQCPSLAERIIVAVSYTHLTLPTKRIV